jgi:hypothetical protein
MYQITLANEAADHPDFMLSLGDTFGDDHTPLTTTDDDMNLLHKNYRQYLGAICNSIPFYVCLGNHEGENDYYMNINGIYTTTANPLPAAPNGIATWDTNWRKYYYPNPYPNSFYTGNTTVENYGIGLPENYYAWTWGDALFVVLDPFWYTNPKPTATTGWNWTLGLTQYNWLKTTLENSSAKFKFIFSHQIVGGDAEGRGGIEFADKYEWGGNNSDGTTAAFTTNRPGWYKPIKDLLTENHTTIFFHGHDHFYDKQDKDCLVYQETPQPSLPNFNYPSQAATYGYLAGQIVANSGHLRVNVSDSAIQVDYVRAYLPANENATRHNKDVSATYTIGLTNCYTLSSNPPIIWNSNYAEEIVYPNPFSKQTTIQFHLDTPSHISIEIYNELGQLVTHLISNNYISNDGTYQVSWDGKNNSGDDVADGVYLYKLTNENGSVKTGKIILKR